MEKLQQRIHKEQVKYEPACHISKTLNEIDGMGQKTFTGKMAISKEDYSQLTALAKEGITSRAEIKSLEQNANYYRQKYFDSANALERMKTKYNEPKKKQGKKKDKSVSRHEEICVIQAKDCDILCLLRYIFSKQKQDRAIPFPIIFLLRF